MNRRLLLALASLIVYGTLTSVVAGTQILWTSGGGNLVPELQSANIDGTNVRVILPTAQVTNVRSLAFDPVHGIAFFGRYAAEYSVNRVSINGGTATELYNLRSFNTTLSNGTPSPYGMCVDTVHNKIYWVGGLNNGDPSQSVTLIQRANLDGSNRETLRQSFGNLSAPFGLVVDGAGGKMYWTDSASHSILRANLDGTGVQTVLSRPGSQLHALAIDFQHQRMFWADAPSGIYRIETALLNGTGVQAIVLPTSANGFSEFGGLAADPSTSKLYFTANTFQDRGQIDVCNYDGSGLQTIISQFPNPQGIALNPVPEPSTLILLAIGGLALVTTAAWRRHVRRRCWQISIFGFERRAAHELQT